MTEPPVSKLKRLTRSFNGLNGNIFNTSQEIDDKDYFEGWIYTGLFFMKCESLKLGIMGKKDLLVKYLKI